ncbi:MAG: 2-amino-4-hydroxy-6-hydroxymethyldihydropteridine diphosphokinase, partial [Bacteroidetes bacterium]|nr:2-amino-4-hydroxy-6-hydroxymethyldihydropteridine diphosphokinase [Bacteroidota bacterium]
MHRVYLGLGSNLGDRADVLQRALDAIADLSGTEVLRCSSVYETEPWGERDQELFYNAVAEIRTSLGPEDLLHALKDIERRLGRTPSKRNGPRLIDIDILLYGSTILRHAQLSIPHPGIPERQFVLVPLEEIAADTMHPVEHVSIRALARRCRDAGKVSRIDFPLTPLSRTP